MCERREGVWGMWWERVGCVQSCERKVCGDVREYVSESRVCVEVVSVLFSKQKKKISGVKNI